MRCCTRYNASKALGCDGKERQRAMIGEDAWRVLWRCSAGNGMERIPRVVVEALSFVELR